jgi:hypothetical protein
MKAAADFEGCRQSCWSALLKMPKTTRFRIPSISLDEQYVGADIDYAPVKKRWFVLSARTTAVVHQRQFHLWRQADQ